jgi:hypothetical protein
MAQEVTSMAVAEELTDEQFNARVMGILQRELNLAEFVRYLRLHRVGTGNYTEDRHQWLDHLTLDELHPELMGEVDVKEKR